MKMYRQGDVLLIETRDAIPTEAKPVKREDGCIVLAHGEVTGHSHAIRAPQAALYDLGAAGRMLRATTRVVLRHEEHGPIELPSANYRVVIQREYSPGELPRTVVD